MTDVDATEPRDLAEAITELPRRRVTRRTFLRGSAAAAGAAVAAETLGIAPPVIRGLQPAGAAAAPTPSPETIVRTGHSNNCDGACGLDVHVRDGQVTLIEGGAFDKTRIDGAPAQADGVDYANRICLRGVSQIQNLYSQDRIKYPYKRSGDRGSGQWEQISWDEAISTIASQFKTVQDKYGKPAVWIAPYTGSMAIIEGVIGAGFRLASAIGASGGDFVGDNEGDSSTPAGFNYVLVDVTNPANLGGFFDGHEFTDMLNAKAIFLWSNNIAETSVPDWRTVMDAKANGTKLVVLDPRFTPTAAAADVWVPIRPGTDTALIDGMINYVITNSLFDETYVRSYSVAPFLVDPDTKLFARDPSAKADDTGAYLVWDEATGQTRRVDDAALGKAALLGTHAAGGKQCRTALQVLADAMAKFTPEKVQELTDVPASQVVEVAKIFAETKPTAVKCGWGLSHWYHGDLTYQALLTLSALTGNIGEHGGGVTTFAGGLTTMAYDFLGWFQPDGLPMFPLLEPMQACDAMLEGKPYPVRAAWFMVDNYAQQMSDRNKVVKALKSLDFLVVSDYVMSATADLADIVLPACTFLEKTDLMGSANFYLQYMDKAVEPLWESKSDYDAIKLVAEKMGVGQYFPATPDDAITDYLHIGSDKADATVKGLTWDQLRNGRPHLNMPTTPYVPFADKTFPSKSGRIEFYVELLVPYAQEVCDYQEPIEASPNNPLFAKYPLIFLSTHTRFRTHSQSVDLPWLKEIIGSGEGFLEINPKDAAPRGIVDGGVVRIFNDRGQMKVRARLTEGMKPGVVNCYQGGWDTNKVKHYIEGHPNNLTHQLANPAQTIVPTFPSNAAYFDCLVEVERS
ncbi:MAG: molybdopterin-dependent oxidoreductase [Chloroflexota bacterium]